MSRLLAAAVAAALLLGCASDKEPEAQWVEGHIEAPSDRVVREMVVASLERMRFPMGSGLDPVKRRVESAWLSSLSPFKGRGVRRRAIIRYEPAAGDTYRVRVRVQLQTNENISRPTDPAYAEWEWAEDDAAAGRVLLQHIRAPFAPGVSGG